MKFQNMKKTVAFTLLLALTAAQPLVSGQKRAKSQNLASHDLTGDQRIVHVLNRLGFGARPGDVERVKAMGLDNYINQQLNPEKISDTVAENKVRDLNVLNMTTAELYEKFPQPGQLLRRLQARGMLPEDLAEARENRVKGGANSTSTEMPKNDSMPSTEMSPDAARNNPNPQPPRVPQRLKWRRMKALSQSWRRAKRYSGLKVSAAFKRTIRRAAFFIEH